MAEFLVHMQLRFPPETSAAFIASHYAAEAEAAKPYLDGGSMQRVWRVPGRRDHYALWDVRDAQEIHDAYTNFPMFPWMDVTVTPLCTNPNDPGTPATDCPGLRMTWGELNKFYNAAFGTLPGPRGALLKEGKTVMLTDTVSIHKHPGSPFPEEFHFMVGDVKVAEIGPDAHTNGEVKAPRYVDILAQWDGEPVASRKWKARILQDNGLLHLDYAHALSGPRAKF